MGATLNGFFRKSRSSKGRRRKNSQKQIFQIEALESRLLLSVSVIGVPDWTPQGPAPITNASNVDLDGNGNPNGTPIRTGDAGDIQVGAIESVAVDPANPAHVAIGAVNGGVWVTPNINAGTVAWTTNTDQMPSLAISAVAFSPTNSNVIYAGTGSYTNGGVGVNFAASVTSPGSGGAAVGVYRSTDGGASWTLLGNSTFAGLRISDVVPTTLNGGQTVFAGTTDVNGANTGGVYRSDDGGATWNRLSGANGLPNQGVTDLIADPNNANRFFAAVASGGSAGVYVLDTGSGTPTAWTNVTGGPLAAALPGQRVLLSISPAGDHPIWAGVINNTGFLQGVFRGVEGGGAVTWTAVGPGGQPPDIFGGYNQGVNPNPQGSNNFSLVADPTQANLVYVGGDRVPTFPFSGNLARGDSTANTWTALDARAGSSGSPGTTVPVAGANPATTAPHADTRAMVFDGNNIIEVDDGGIYQLANPTASSGAPTWSALEGNLQVGEVYNVAIDTLNTATTADDVLMDAQQDDGANQRNATTGVWTESDGGDGTIVLADSANGHRYFSSQNFTLVRQDGGGARVIPAATVTGTAGLTLNSAVSGGTLIENFPFTTAAVLNGSNPNRMLVGGTATLYESTDDANTFRSVGGLNATNTAAQTITGLAGTIMAIAFGNTANANVAYVSDNSGNLVMTTNITATGGGFVATDFSTVAGGNAALGIVIDPNNASIAYAVTNTGVFKTTNGTNWTSITGNILQVAQSGGLNTLASIAFFNNGTATASDDVLLVGGLGGVFRTLASGTPNWSEYGQNLPNVLVTSLSYSAQADTLLVGTYGRGTWTVSNASTTLGVQGVLEIDGDTDFAGEDDTIRLVVDGSNPSLLDVFLNNAESQYQLSTLSQINVNGLGGTDKLIVDSSNGLITVGNGIRYDGGGGGGDSLELVQTGGSARTSDTYSVGPNIGSGVSTIVGGAGAGTQVVSFQNLSPVLDTVAAASLTVNATASDNAINYSTGSLLTTGLVSIDSQEPIEFANKTALTINAGAGHDSVNLNNPNTPTGLTHITVNGGDPTDGDTLTVNGIAGQLDNLRYLPTAVGAGTIVNDTAPQPQVTFTGIEQLTEVVQQADGDGVRIDGTTGNDALEFFPGLTSDSGMFVGTMDQNNATGVGPFTMTPMSYTGASPVANDTDVNFFNPGGTDSIAFDGTANDDTITVQTGEAGGTEFRNTLNGIIVSRLEVFNVASGLVRSLDGNDTINVNVPAGPAAVALRIEGGDSDQFTDTLNYAAPAGANTTIDYGASSITSPGANPVTFSGIERINETSSGAGSTLTIRGTAGNDGITYTPTGANAGSVAFAGQNLVTNFSGVGGAFTIDPLGGSDTLSVNGSNASDTINADVSGSTGSVTFTGGPALKAVNLPTANTEQLGLFGLDGSDTFNVTPGSVPVFVDGGNPIGALPGDLLNILAGGGSVTYNTGPQTDEGSFVVGANQPVSFDHIESLGVSGSGPAVINGTNGPDAITVIARDSSYNPLADGVQDFTVSVNSGPQLLFLNVPTLTINALGGSDQITLQTPAPNNAVWNVNVTIDGGPPAAGTDQLIVQTPGTLAESVTYTPTAFDGGSLNLTSLTSLVTLTGIEALTYDGQGDNDNLTIVGTGGDDSITHTPGANDQAGSFQVNGLLALSYQNLGSGGSLTVDGSGGTDTLTYNGTALNDTFMIGPAGQITLNSRLVVNTTGVEILTLNGLAGDDTFNLVPAISAMPYQTLNINGGGQASTTGDRVNLIGTAGDDSIAISGQTVSLGGRTVQMTGIEDVHLDALTGNNVMTYTGVSGVTENITVSGSSVAGTGQISVPGVVLVDFVGVQLVNAIGNAADNDTLTFAGTNAPDLFQINLAAAGTPADPVLKLQNSTGATTELTLGNYSGFNTLNVLGLDGNDTFNVYVSPTGQSRNLHIDGGISTGKKKQTDILNVIYTPPRPSIISSTATQNPTSGIVTLNYGTSRFVVQYDDIEQTTIRKA